MSKDDKIAPSELRSRAERILQNLTTEIDLPYSKKETLLLIHELQVYQTELEMQNEELAASQTQLETSNARYTELYERSPFGYITLDQAGTVTQANITAAEILKTNQSQLSGAQLGFFVAMSDRRNFNAFLSSVRSTGIKQFCNVQLNSDSDETTFFRLDASLSQDKQECHVSLVDITERENMATELGKLAQVVEQSPSCIVITNRRGNIEYVNEAFVQLTGYGRQELIGNNPRMLQSGFTPKQNYRALWAALRHSQPWRGELYNRHKDGTNFVVFATITPLTTLDGKTSHYVAVEEDITSRKIIDKELEQHRYHLEQLVEQRTNQLVDAQLKAETANQAKSVFLANMSHEIRTPMNAIIGLTHLLKLADTLPGQTDRLNKIDNAAEHLLAVINDVLDLSKIESGKLVLEDMSFNLETTLNSVMELVKEQVETKGLKFELENLCETEWLSGDITRLRQALLNYLSNAIKFTEQGTITLRARQLEHTDKDILLRLEVEDTGIGIATVELEKLFQAFEQADASTTRKYGGTGLGLTINRRLAKLMGGQVGLESQLGVGSTFWFTARFGHGEQTEVVAEPAIPVSTHRMDPIDNAGTAILLVEDNFINREVALALLSQSGLAADTATNGMEALEMVNMRVYDLILMDVQMPKMDGLQATRMIRAMESSSHAVKRANSKTPILAMTANVFAEDRKACLEAGMNDFIAKPVDPENLNSVIAKWLPAQEGKNQV